MSCSIIIVRSPKPDKIGSSTSVKIRSMLFDFSFRASHAFIPSATAATIPEEKNNKKKEIRKLIT